MPAAGRPSRAGTVMKRRELITGLAAGLTVGLTAGCGRVEFLAANIPASFGAYRRHPDVAYGPEPEHRLDVYVPSRLRSQPAPLVVFWHGGRWSFGSKGDYRFVGAALAELGLVSMVADYRLYPKVKMPGFMHDVGLAAVWAAAHAADYGADPARLYFMGHSSGAHMAALAALDPRYFERAPPPIAGMIGLSGPYDFLPLDAADTEDMFGPPALYPESQPIDFVRAGAPPMLLVHGLADETVWPKNTRNLATALRGVGVPAVLKLYPKLGHGDTVAALSRPARGRAAILADIDEFIRPPRSS
jgi:acetyl esterase/lipase